MAVLQPGDTLELVPGSSPMEPPSVRIEYGIFQVGVVPDPQCTLLWRLLHKGFHVSGRIVRIENDNPADRALWVEVYLA